jgi:transglutaminase-like putative cysteine protease
VGKNSQHPLKKLLMAANWFFNLKSGPVCCTMGADKGRMSRYFRITFLIALLVFPLLACQPLREKSTSLGATPSPYLTVLSHQEYQVRQTLTLVNQGPGQPEKQNLWVALIRTLPPYQEVLSLEVTPNEYTLITDEYGNQYAEFNLSDHPAGTTKVVQIDYLLVVNELTYDLTACEGELPDDFTRPELHIESANPQIIALANQLSQGKKDTCGQVRAFYNYIGDNLVYTYNGENWGAQATLGPMGADCTEYASLMVALSRAQKIPARYFEGLLVLGDDTRNLARLEHAWADVYLPGIGWVSIDPTLGRSPLTRETYFAHHTPEHIILTLGPAPSTLRGSSYWTHIYWPGNSTRIQVQAGEWDIQPVN